MFPNHNDRFNFARAIIKTGVPHGELPVELCFIFDTHAEMFPDKSPVIEHMQASRRLKNEVKKPKE